MAHRTLPLVWSLGAVLAIAAGCDRSAPTGPATTASDQGAKQQAPGNEPAPSGQLSTDRAATPETQQDEAPATSPLPEQAPAAEQAAAEAQPVDEKPAESLPPEVPREPLLDEGESLQPLHPKYPAWLTKDRKSVVLVGEVCQRQAPLELFACKRGSKEHESVVVFDVEAYVIHAGLMATGAEPGNPVQFHPEFVPARGTEIAISLRWKSKKGTVERARGQDWVRNMRTKQPLAYAWVFAGSRFVKSEEDGEQIYLAEGGDLICVSNFPSALLDLPVASSDSNESLLYEAFTERIPPLGTQVTVLLSPVNKK